MKRPDIPAFLARLRIAIERDDVLVTRSAADQAAQLGWERVELVDELGYLEAIDFLRTEDSVVRPGDLVWVFCPPFEGGRELWIRLVEPNQVVVVSFHIREW